MCGRYQLVADATALSASHRNAKWAAPEAEQQHKPRQQVRPTTRAPVLLHEGAVPTFCTMKWGFSRGSSPLINARKETVLDLPTFRANMSRRCAIPITGFFEWQKDIGPGKSSKTPFLVRGFPRAKFEDEKVMYMAGLYRKERHGGDAFDTFVVLTENSASELGWLHNRQPVFLEDEQHVETWLSHHVSASDAVTTLDGTNGFSWWRMKPDLSDRFRGRVLQQKGLDAFFGFKGKVKKDVDLKVRSPIQKRQKKILGPKPQSHETDPLSSSKKVRIPKRTS
ncbi:unnamed protein product [Agarophyton chilense]